MKKRDGRTLDRKTMAVIRRDAVERVRAGENVSTVMAGYRMARTTFYKWTARMEAGDGTVRSLRARKARGRVSLLNAEQKQAVRRAIVGRDPREHGFDFGLWTRAAVRALILERWGIACSVEAVGKLLRELKLTPQRPLTRAWQQDPKAVAHWRKHRFPALRREAQAAGAELLFLDETGFRADAQMGRTWGAKGKTPVIQRDGRRPSVNVIGMVSALGAFYWQVFQGSFHAGRFVEFLRAFMSGRGKPVIIVLDRHPVHTAAAVLREADSSGGRLRFEYLPTYAPELNPQEHAWRYAKRTGTSRAPLRIGESLPERAARDLAAMKHRPRLIRSFFEQPETVYIHNVA
ncbi:MAG: IS630 family transposase [Verrucomicrobiaceae bacterium]|nr:MAG: IS630 family transposase [Verrucomicrobiaceae bacterium]